MKRAHRNRTARSTVGRCVTNPTARISAAIQREAFRTMNNTVRPVLETGLGNPLPIGLGVSVVETTGRRTGRPRSVPLLTARFGDRLVASTVRGNSHWLANLEAKPEAQVNLFGARRAAHAAVRRGPLNIAVLGLTST
jgi:hypothetical protein